MRNYSGAFEDRVAVRELYESYADAITRRDAPLWGSCWSAQGKWQPSDEAYEGRDVIVDRWIYMMKNESGLKGRNTRLFQNQPAAIMIDGDSGYGWSYTNELIVDQQNMTYHLNGLYADRYIREDGHWMFEERIFKKVHLDHPY
ncbi:nuclear transport factor 2 family protein [Aquisediminimonas sediminicola]|uniref:nuclear transport factor 2 family protein n=1 Tax=Alteraquisediminimonas sediminicola TaxID=2676787 RepID=UPI001C8D2C4D|nr:nuclear transport factor 2 family protein [Aquisediminimonas sediminicola]